jgi:hypothetical protein
VRDQGTKGHADAHVDTCQGCRYVIEGRREEKTHNGEVRGGGDGGGGDAEEEEGAGRAARVDAAVEAASRATSAATASECMFTRWFRA